MARHSAPDNTGKKYKKRAQTPQQLAFIAYYNDPTSESYGNARQSALRAGYTQDYADNITVESPNWMTDSVRHASLVKKAEQNMRDIVDMPINKAETNPSIMKVWQDSNKFLLERLGKESYSSRQELTGKGGKQLFSDERRAEIESTLDSMLDS